MNCPECESVLTYPEKCSCGWVWRAPIVAQPCEADLVKQRVTLQAQKAAQVWDELRGAGQREYEPRYVEHRQREGLMALKGMLRRG